MSRITAERFIRTWQTGESLSDVAHKLGIAESYAVTRASGLRKKGIPLKKFTVNVNHLDIEALAQMARELEK